MSDADEQELTPTPEQVRGFSQRVRGTLAMAAYNRFAASLTNQQLFGHPVHTGCIVIPQLSSEISLLEVGDAIGLGAPKKHATWLNFWPFSAIVATKNELFLVSRAFEWQGTELPSLAISTGKLTPSLLLSRLCNQEEIYLYGVDDARLIHSARMLSEANPVRVFKSLENVPILQTREAYEKQQDKNVTGDFAQVEKHFTS